MGSPLEMANTSRVWLQNGRLHLRNNSGFYLALSSLDVSGAGKTAHSERNNRTVGDDVVACKNFAIERRANALD